MLPSEQPGFDWRRTLNYHSSKHSGATGPARPFILPRSGNENRAMPGLKAEPSTRVVPPSTTTGGATVSKAPSIPDQ